MAYTAAHDVSHNQVDFRPGDIVRFDELDHAQYEELKIGPIATLLASGAIVPEPTRVTVPLDQQPVDQLVTVAHAMGLEVTEPLDRGLILASIAEAKARLAAPPPPNTPPLPPVGGTFMTGEGMRSTPSDPAPVIPVLTADMDRARLVEIANEHRVEFAQNLSEAKLRALLDDTRTQRAAPPAA